MLTLSSQIQLMERQEDAKSSSNAAQGRVTLAPWLFVGFSFSSCLQSSANARCCGQSFIGIFSLKPCI